MKLLITFLLAMAIAACAVTPPADTNNKRLASVEITWKNTLEAISLNIDRLSDDQKATLRAELPRVESAIKAAHLALDIADQTSFENQISTINSGIRILRSLLENIEETNYVPNFKRYHAARPGCGRVGGLVGNHYALPDRGERRARCYEGGAAVVALWQRGALRRSNVEALA